MGDSTLRTPEPPHLYTLHPSTIHSERLRVARHSAALYHCPSSAAPSALALSLLQQHTSGSRTPQPPGSHPPHLLLQPLLHLVSLHTAAALSASAGPTVIVSPHYQSPTSERDHTSAVKSSFTKPTASARQKLDGNNGTSHGVQRSAPMTTNGVVTMASKREEKAQFPRSQRPSIVSQHSSSVPSTPLQTARQFESRSRSPSPNGGLGSHSPRSVSSEANGPMPTLRAAKPGHSCKYETNAAFGRRRMPYTSSDILEKAKEEPKKTLDPEEDDKLTGDMRTLYDRLVPSQESKDRRAAFVQKLENILHTEWPGNEFTVHVFGSSGNDLYTNESDVDICIQTPMKRLEEMHMLAAALDKHGMERVVCIPQAKVRIVKVWDPELKLACDMNVNNTLALENTRMIKTYVQIDERVRPLAMIVKHWTKQRMMNDAAVGGTISSYTWICMILNFLQTRDPPIIPSLHILKRQKTDDTKACSSDSGFVDDIEKLRGCGQKNKESIGQLLLQFFRRYGHEVDYEKDVISVREGRLLSREEKRWETKFLTKEARNRLCVEEPFNTERNLGNSADDFAWRGIHLELRRAFDLLVDGQQLDKVCEQFEFPPEEKSTIFRKPTTSVKPILQMPGTRGGRGGHRGGRGGGFNQKNNHGYGGRRASSSASFNGNRPPFLHSPPIGPMSAQEYFPRGLNDQLHDQLFQQYQMLEMQSNSLRAQLAAQQRVQQVHQAQVAQMHAHAVAQAQAQAQSRGQSSTNGSPQKSPYVNGSSPRMQEMAMPANAIPQFYYQYPGMFDPTQGNAATQQDGPRTNPSSPSLTHSVPGLRRNVHRASNASDTGSIRSQSQPARGGQPQALVASYPPMPYFDPSTFAGYPIARSTQEVPPSQATSEVPYSPLSQQPDTVASSEQSTPKEYVGYYVADDAQTRPQLQEYSVQAIPSYTELAQRRRRVSSEITQPLLNTALRRVSRSPSPLGGHMRSYTAIGVTSPDLDAQPRKDRIDSARPPVDSGPIIANGSFPTPPREPRNRSGTIDALPSFDMANASALGIYTNSQEQQPRTLSRKPEPLTHEALQRQRATDHMMATIVNGSTMAGAPSAEEGHSLARVPSGGKQPSPRAAENWPRHEPSKQEKPSQPANVSPTKKQQQQQWRPVAYTNGVTPLDTLNAPRPPPQEIKSAGLPLLSPVFETRTPSPTASRQVETSKLVNGVKSQPKENQQQRRASHTPAHTAPKEGGGRGNQQKGHAQNNEKTAKGNTGNNHTNNWQTTQKKNKKKNKPKSNTETKTSGEPVPANAADRKGG